MHERNHRIVSTTRKRHRIVISAQQCNPRGEGRSLYEIYEREPRYTESEVHRRKLLSSRNRVQYLAQRVKGIVERNGGGATG